MSQPWPATISSKISAPSGDVVQGREFGPEGGALLGHGAGLGYGMFKEVQASADGDQRGGHLMGGSRRPSMSTE